MKPYNDNSFRTTLICLDKYDNKVPVGRIYNSFYQGGIEFNNTMDFLLSIENMLEDMNFPQSFSSRRYFRPVENKPVSEVSTETVKEGEIATFSLRILFRQNSSWQGSLVWHEGKQEESFRSVLELLFLLDSASSS